MPPARSFRRSLVACLAALLLSARAGDVGAQETRTIRGRVVAEHDSTAVAGVTVTIVGTPRLVVTDNDGAFALLDAPRGFFRLALGGPLVRRDTIAIPAGVDSVTIIAHLLEVTLPPVTVTAPVLARERFENLAQTSTVSLSATEARTAPLLLEPDLIRVVQLLPGTVSRNDYSIGFNVRGGENDQNLILLDGIPVFNPSHLGGLFSTFDVGAVDRADFLTGGFPARYNGRLSSVLDVRLRDGAERLGARGAVSLLSSRLILEGPLGERSPRGGGSDPACRTARSWASGRTASTAPPWARSSGAIWSPSRPSGTPRASPSTTVST